MGVHCEDVWGSILTLLKNNIFSRFCLILDQKQEPEPDTESEEQLRAFLAENFDNKPTEKNSGTGEFKPFPRDPAKQKRYEQYLVCVQNGRGKIALKILQVNNFKKVLFFQQFIKNLAYLSAQQN